MPHVYIETGISIPPSRAGISHAVVTGPFCHIGGQLSVSLDGVFCPGTIQQQTKRSFENFFAVLNESGFRVTDIVYLELAFKDINELEAVSSIYNTYFPEHFRPCRTVHQVSALPYDAKIRVHGIAIKTSAFKEISC